MHRAAEIAIFHGSGDIITTWILVTSLVITEVRIRLCPSALLEDKIRLLTENETPLSRLDVIASTSIAYIPRKLSEGLVLHQNFWRLWIYNMMEFLSSGFLGMTITASEADPTGRTLFLYEDEGFYK